MARSYLNGSEDDWRKMRNDDTFPEVPILFYKGAPMIRAKLRRTGITKGPNRRKCDHCSKFVVPGELAWRPVLDGGPVPRYVRVCDLCMKEVGVVGPKWETQGDSRVR